MGLQMLSLLARQTTTSMLALVAQCAHALPDPLPGGAAHQQPRQVSHQPAREGRRHGGRESKQVPGGRGPPADEGAHQGGPGLRRPARAVLGGGPAGLQGRRQAN
eukprot:scaffold25548_cov34-Prasinocladus_malaysianus.AAC.2